MVLSKILDGNLRSHRKIAMKKISIILISLFILPAVLSGQDRQIRLTVVNNNGKPLKGVEVSIPDISEPVITDENGIAELFAPYGTDVELSIYNEYFRRVNLNSGEMTITLDNRHQLLGIGYGATATKETSSSAVSGVGRAVFENSSGNTIMNSLYGLIPGLAVRQNGSGEWPEDCTPSLNVRGQGSFSGNSVLVLVDGIPREPSTIDIEEVENVTILKDAASLAIYGIRGADGAVLITTRRGGSHRLNLKAEYNFGVQTPFKIAEMATPAEYAHALNEARENDGLTSWFSDSDIASIESGTSGIIPSVNWKNHIFRNIGFNNSARLTMDGSTRHIKYFVYAGYNSNRGFYKNTDILEGIDTQNSYDGLKLRTNLNIDMTSTTEVTVNLAARIQQKSGPSSGTTLQSFYQAPPVGFPIKYNNIWARSTKFSNPVQDILGTGGTVTFGRMLSADLGIRQRLDMVLKGLSAEIKIAYDNSANVNDNRSFGSSWYNFSPLYDNSGNISDYDVIQYGNDTEMSYGTALASQYMRMTVWGKLGWTRNFARHHIDAAFLFNRDKKSLTGANNSFIHHDYILSASYNYADRYVATVTASYSGSSRMPKGDKFRFYPAVSLGWIVSGEDFLRNSDIVNFLKLRGSFGVVGQDEFLAYDMNVQFNGEGKSYIFVQPTVYPGASEGSLPSAGVEPELDVKANLGLDFTLFKGLSGEIDIFRNKRSNIRTIATNDLSQVLGIGASDSFSGKTLNYGIETALQWSQTISDFNYHIGGTLSFARSRIDNISEEYKPNEYMYQRGLSIGSFYGLVADGFYQKTDFDKNGQLLSDLPQNTFASVQPGDVKYRDLNGDGKIDNYDYCYQLKPILPELYYGFRVDMKWKGIGFNAQFQGVASARIETTLAGIYQPLYAGDKNISGHYLKSYWTDSKPDGRYPRLTTLDNANNYLSSNLWTENGAFLKLRELEIYYNLPEKISKTLKMDNIRLYFRGHNLFSIDHIKILDPEAVNFNYPTARTYSIGLRVNF